MWTYTHIYNYVKLASSCLKNMHLTFPDIESWPLRPYLSDDFLTAGVDVAHHPWGLFFDGADSLDGGR
jgi:hypothetical protein